MCRTEMLKMIENKGILAQIKYSMVVDGSKYKHMICGNEVTYIKKYSMGLYQGSM